MNKRYKIMRDDLRIVAEFDYLYQAEEYMERVCDDYTRGETRGWWWLDSGPIFLEIVDWSAQLDPMAVC